MISNFFKVHFNSVLLQIIFVLKSNIWDKVLKSGLSKFCGCRPYPFKFFKGCLLQNLLSPFLNTLSHMSGMKVCRFVVANIQVMKNKNSCSFHALFLDNLIDTYFIFYFAGVTFDWLITLKSHWPNFIGTAQSVLSYSI